MSASAAWDASLVRVYDALPFRGVVSYALAGFWSFFGYRPQPLEAVVDGGETLRFDKPLLFTVGNLAGWGGGALIDADASADDGRLELIAEYEEKRFGTPFAEFDDDVRLPECDGNWDIMAEARPLDIDHSVDEEVISSLQNELLEELIAAEQAAEKAAAEAVEADEADKTDTDEQEVLT